MECPVEYLGLGRILLFYSPRNLLSPLLKDQDVNLIGTDRIEALGESEESPHKGFPLIQNQHGTFMFHVKDLFLLDRWAELKETGLNYLRIDLRFEQDRALLKEISKIQNDFTVGESVKALYQKDVIRGYYQINKSDVLFKKLKNYRIQRKDESYVGEVIEISKGQYLAISIKSDTSLRIDEQLKFITPEGKEYFCKVHTLRDSSYTERLSSEGKSLILMNYMGGVWPKSQVYLAQ